MNAVEDTNRFLIFDSTSATNAIAGIQVFGNHIKGDKEHWGLYIGVKNLGTASKIVQQHGGDIVAEGFLCAWCLPSIGAGLSGSIP